MCLSKFKYTIYMKIISTSKFVHYHEYNLVCVVISEVMIKNTQ